MVNKKFNGSRAEIEKLNINGTAGKHQIKLINGKRSIDIHEKYLRLISVRQT